MLLRLSLVLYGASAPVHGSLYSGETRIAPWSVRHSQ